jgi:NAD(P)-dependent dehydrogenase (short-subunit alcohol dehydrogenase family)
MMLAEARRHVWTRQVSGGLLMVLLLGPAVVQAQAMRWPEAVAALAAERTRAETCGRLLKRHAGDNTAALSRGELAYAEAKADVDAVIAGLTVVLAQQGTPPDLPGVEARLTRGVQAREAFCRQVIALVPEDPGTRDLLVSLLGAFLPPLLEAARTLYTGQTAQDRLLRQTIQTQLEATTWAAFADITP